MLYTKRIIVIFICNLCYNCFLFSQEYIHPLNKDSINRSDWMGKQGTWYVFNDSTEIIYSKINYKNNLKHGYFEEYDITGRIVKQGFHKYGMLDSIYREYEKKGTFIDVYFDYGISKGIVSKSGNLLYEIKCNIESKGISVRATDLLLKDGKIISASEDMRNNLICNDTNDNAIYSFSYYDEEESKEYFKTWKGERCSFCPKLDTIYDFGIKSIYYNNCLYKKIYYERRHNGDLVGITEVFFIDGQKTMQNLYRSRRPYAIKSIAYYNKDGYIYQTKDYNRKGMLKKTYLLQITKNNKTKWFRR